MASTSAPQQQQQQPSREEFIVRVPTLLEHKKYSVLKFNANLGVDVAQWSQIGLEREDNAQIYTEQNADPQFGAGSEYGKQARMEARRKKLGFRSKRYRLDDQPWVMTLPGKPERKYRGLKEGSFSEHADYWIFVKAGDSVFDAYPIADWYNFLPISRYKTLDCDEAEEKFKLRDKVLNRFALKSFFKHESDATDDVAESSKMPLKGGDGEGESGKKSKPNKDEDDEPKKNKAQKKRKRKEKSKFADDEDPFASADSDDGDGEGREVDYMSDSDLSVSSDEEEPEDFKVRKALVGVDEEAGMRHLIASDDEDEEEPEKNAEEETKIDLNKAETVPTSSGFDDADESDSGTDSDDPDKEDIKSALFMQQKKVGDNAPSTSASGTSDATSNKRKHGESSDQPAAKKSKVDKEKSKGEKGFTEEEVRRYLQRRPLSTTDLVSKFKPRCQGMSKPEIVQKLADILKRLKPVQEKRNGMLYFFLNKE